MLHLRVMPGYRLFFGCLNRLRECVRRARALWVWLCVGVFGGLSWRFVLFGVGCVSLILVSETDSAPPDSETPRESGTAKVSGERKTVADQPKNVSAALATVDPRRGCSVKWCVRVLCENSIVCQCTFV